jgi:hypothetical protein
MVCGGDEWKEHGCHGLPVAFLSVLSKSNEIERGWWGEVG